MEKKKEVTLTTLAARVEAAKAKLEAEKAARKAANEEYKKRKK